MIAHEPGWEDYCASLDGEPPTHECWLCGDDAVCSACPVCDQACCPHCWDRCCEADEEPDPDDDWPALGREVP